MAYGNPIANKIKNSRKEKSFRLFYLILKSSYAVVEFGNADTDSHIVINDLAYLRIADGTHEAVGIGEVQRELIHKEVHCVTHGDLGALFKSFAGGEEIDAVGSLDDRALNGAVAIHSDLQAHAACGLNACAVQLAVTHAGVHIADGKTRTLNTDGEVNS